MSQTPDILPDEPLTNYQLLRSMVFDMCKALYSEYFPIGGIIHPRHGLQLQREGNILNIVGTEDKMAIILRSAEDLPDKDLHELALGICQMSGMDTASVKQHGPKTAKIIMAGCPPRLAMAFNAWGTMSQRHRASGEEQFRMQAALWAWIILTSNGELTIPQGTEVLVPATAEKMTTEQQGTGKRIVTIPKGTEMVIMGGEFRVVTVGRLTMTLEARQGTEINPRVPLPSTMGREGE